MFRASEKELAIAKTSGKMTKIVEEIEDKLGSIANHNQSVNAWDGNIRDAKSRKQMLFEEIVDLRKELVPHIAEMAALTQLPKANVPIVKGFNYIREKNAYNRLSLIIKPDHWSLKLQTRYMADNDGGELWLNTDSAFGKEGRSLCNILKKWGKNRDDWYRLGCRVKIFTAPLATALHEHDKNPPQKANRQLHLAMDFTKLEPTWLITDQVPLEPYDGTRVEKWWTDTRLAGEANSNWRDFLPMVQNYVDALKIVEPLSAFLAMVLEIKQPKLEIKQPPITSQKGE